MKKKLPMLIGGFLAVLVVVGAIGAGIVYADDATPPTPSAMPADGRGPRAGRGMSAAELEAAAPILGMTTDELSTALKDGKTLEELATAAGVDIADVQKALQTVRHEEMRAQITQAVTDGTISPDKADWLLEGLDKGYLDGPGFGLGFGRGGPGDHGQPPAGDPSTVQPTPTTSE
jgi:uncharacterized membrane protein